MTDTQTLDFSDRPDIAQQMSRDGAANSPARHLSCTWGRDPATGRLECHWVTAPARH